MEKKAFVVVTHKRQFGMFADRTFVLSDRRLNEVESSS